ncbi:MAG: hypothetical protein JWM11_4220 [Planctomycetaceae bacterium]|nr:hypothetical protein [Planctomycetaceae bacterium]
MIFLNRYPRLISAVFLCCVGPGLPVITHAAEMVRAEPVAIPALRQSHSRGWEVVESPNFRFFHQKQSALVTRLAKLCEESRTVIRDRWLGSAAKQTWVIKCDVYLYAVAADFQRQTRCPADTLGVADLEIGEGKVWKRRVYLRSDHEACLAVIGVHELAHVILAERFTQRQIPRWADEGIALNSEPLSRQQDTRRWLAAEVRQGRGFTLFQLISMRQLPQDKLWGDLFYAQSGSLIEYLLSQNSNSEEAVLQIVESWQQQGPDQSSQRATLAKLEAEWKAWLLKSDATGESGRQVAADRP